MSFAHKPWTRPEPLVPKAQTRSAVDKGPDRNSAWWLVANGYAMPADARTVHLGSYSKFEPEFGVPENMYDVEDEDGRSAR